MPHAVLDILSVAALVGLLTVAFRHPRGRVEVVAGATAAGAVLAAGATPWSSALAQLRLLLPVVAFLAAILVVAEMCAAEGVFAAVGGGLARLGRGNPRRMLVLSFAAAASTTAVLSLDATAVLLTPVVAVAATSMAVSPRPLVHACVRLANSASLLLPVSNLTNLLALPSVPSLSFVGFALLMAPVWLVVLAVEYAGHRLYFAADLRDSGRAASASPQRAPVPVAPLVVVGSMLVAFAALSPLGVEPAWPAAAAAVLLVAHARSRRLMQVGTAIRAAQLPFCFFVLCLGVVVAALADTFLGDLVESTVPSGTGLGSLLTVALVATLLANLVNNLPATLLLVPVVAPLGVTAVLAALIGLGAGSGLSYTGSLANLLWRRSLVARGMRPSPREFHRLSAMLTGPAVVLGVLALWAWAGLLGY